MLWLPGAALVLLSPFRTGAAHIMQLWPARLERKSRKPVPSRAVVLPPCAELGVANSTLKTHEAKNSFISNLSLVYGPGENASRYRMEKSQRLDE